jgi:hypothetical protein
MNAMNYLMRSLIAVPIIASLSVSGGVSSAALPSTSDKILAAATLYLSRFSRFQIVPFFIGHG